MITTTYGKEVNEVNFNDPDHAWQMVQVVFENENQVEDYGWEENRDDWSK